MKGHLMTEKQASAHSIKDSGVLIFVLILDLELDSLLRRLALLDRTSSLAIIGHITDITFLLHALALRRASSSWFLG